jgi:hypothetical protein
MTSYGLLGSVFDRGGVSLRATPGHIDGAAGLKPFGDYYLSQASCSPSPQLSCLPSR